LAITFCVFLITMKPKFAVTGLIIVLAGIPIYFFAASRKKVGAA